MFNELKVLELSNVLAGPAVGMFFAELGAEVIKVENKLSNGDITRNWKLPKEKKEDLSAYFCSVNYNKQHIFLDFTKKEDLLELEKLIKECDILITNFKYGDAEKFNLDFESCKAIKNDIIYAHIGGFKSNAKRVAFDIILQAETGYIKMTGNKNNFAKMPVALIDVLAAHQIKEGILTALILQNKNKKAFKVTTTLEETAIASLMNQSSNYLMANYSAQPIGTLHPNISPYGEIIDTLDKKKLILAIGTDKQFKIFGELIGLEKKWLQFYKNNVQRVEERDKLLKIIIDKTKIIKRKKILTFCQEFKIPIGEINSIKEVLEKKVAKKMILEETIGNQKTKRIKTVAFKLTS
jgi:crotonobetainyl-CoA:carnitine CoA-transferase CaiB-like acyl-CoA transferase